MVLADGEYELDISVLKNRLVDRDSGRYFGIRYGFIPDSMDQGAGATLYRLEDEFILEASTSERCEQSKVYFEGKSQRLGLGRRRMSSDTYVLVVLEDEGQGLVLEKLRETIRMSKSRNVARVRDQVESWKQQTKSFEVDDMDLGKRMEPRRRPIASKRPPGQVGSGSGGASGIVKVEKGKKLEKNLQDQDDEFKDLENELEEVLVEGQEPSGRDLGLKQDSGGTVIASDSYKDESEDDDDTQLLGERVKINFKDDSLDTGKISHTYYYDQSRKPKSLRDLVGESSEEE